MNKIDGYKTYIVGTIVLVVGVGGLALHYIDPSSQFAMDPNTAYESILLGLTAFGLRSAVSKLEK